MTQTCRPIPQAVANHMVQGLVETICDRPGQTAARREARATEVAHSVLAFQPRDAVEMMLAGMVVTHAHLIAHTAHDAFRTRPEDLQPRTLSGIVALGRGMVGFVKQLQAARTRPMEGAMEVAATTEPTAAPEQHDAIPQSPAPRQPPPPVMAERREAAMPAASPRRTGSSSAAMMAVLSPAPKPSAAKAALTPSAAAAKPSGETAMRSPASISPASIMTGAHLPGLPGAPVTVPFGHLGALAAALKSVDAGAR